MLSLWRSILRRIIDAREEMSILSIKKLTITTIAWTARRLGMEVIGFEEVWWMLFVVEEGRHLTWLCSLRLFSVLYTCTIVS
jgi:hypothetical protein